VVLERAGLCRLSSGVLLRKSVGLLRLLSDFILRNCADLLSRRLFAVFSNNKQNCSSNFEQKPEQNASPKLPMVNFLKYVASEERKRRVGQERKHQKRKKKISFVSGTVKMPIGSNVTIAKARVLKRLSKNDSVLHKVCSTGRACP
jgi:hypothetical protein